MLDAPPAPKRRGRKPGVKLGPRVGSRPWALSRLGPGESLLLEAPPGRTQAFMQQISADIHRTTDGGYSQALILGVSPSDRSVVDIIRVTRAPGGQPTTPPVLNSADRS